MNTQTSGFISAIVSLGTLSRPTEGFRKVTKISLNSIRQAKTEPRTGCLAGTAGSSVTAFGTYTTDLTRLRDLAASVVEAGRVVFIDLSAFRTSAAEGLWSGTTLTSLSIRSHSSKGTSRRRC